MREDLGELVELVAGLLELREAHVQLLGPAAQAEQADEVEHEQREHLATSTAGRARGEVDLAREEREPRNAKQQGRAQPSKHLRRARARAARRAGVRRNQHDGRRTASSQKGFGRDDV